MNTSETNENPAASDLSSAAGSAQKRPINKRYSIEKIGFGYIVRRVLTMSADWHDVDYLSTMSGPYLFTNCIYSAKHFRFKWQARKWQRRLQLQSTD
jgi:hypothetical protein